MKTLYALVLLIVTSASTQVLAQGNHLGWCIGVGNKHNSASCPSTGGSSSGTVTTPPQVNQLPTASVSPTSTQIVTAVPSPQLVVQSVPSQITGTQTTPSYAVPYPIPYAIPQPLQLTPSQITAPQTAPSYAIPYPIPYAIPQPLQLTPSQVSPLIGNGQTPASLPVPQPTVQLSPILPASGQSTPPSLASIPPGSTQTIIVTFPRPRPNQPLPVSGKPLTPPVIIDRPANPSIGATLTTAAPGSQAPHALPKFQVTEGNSRSRMIDCISSGHGRRETNTGSAAGTLSHLAAIDMVARDAPAEHPSTTGCMVAVERRKP